MGYAAGTQQGAAWLSCGHVHDTIDEALACGVEQQQRTGASAVTVVGSEMGADGVPRDRDLTPSERAELVALQGA
jgi:hypothetical protein